MSNICPDCGGTYQRIAQHWSLSSCQSPELSDEQYEILVGLLMGDGTVGFSTKGTPRIEVNMITEEYLHHLDSKFPVYGKGVRLVNSAEENARRDRESGFNPSADLSNYSNTYRWSTMMSDVFSDFGDWYSSGEKVWPSDISLTPMTLKHLYCCDGYYRNTDTHDYITIAMNNERGNLSKVEQMFADSGLPAPTWQNYDNGDRNDCTARFTKSQSLTLWEYMGEPLPGFEYKWPTFVQT